MAERFLFLRGRFWFCLGGLDDIRPHSMPESFDFLWVLLYYSGGNIYEEKL